MNNIVFWRKVLFLKEKIRKLFSNIWTIPNVLTIIRMLLIPVILLLLAVLAGLYWRRNMQVRWDFENIFWKFLKSGQKLALCLHFICYNFIQSIILRIRMGCLDTEQMCTYKNKFQIKLMYKLHNKPKSDIILTDALKANNKMGVL